MHVIEKNFRIYIIPEQPIIGGIKPKSNTTYPDILVEEKSNLLQNSNNIYEGRIDGAFNIFTIFQQMTKVVTAYRTSHDHTDQLTAHILITGFIEQLKG